MFGVNDYMNNPYHSSMTQSAPLSIPGTSSSSYGQSTCSDGLIYSHPYAFQPQQHSDSLAHQKQNMRLKDQIGQLMQSLNKIMSGNAPIFPQIPRFVSPIVNRMNFHGMNVHRASRSIVQSLNAHTLREYECPRCEELQSPIQEEVR